MQARQTQEAAAASSFGAHHARHGSSAGRESEASTDSECEGTPPHAIQVFPPDRSQIMSWEA